MNRAAVLALCLFLAASAWSTFAYDPVTHFDMSSEAAQKSVLGQADTLADLGFSKPVGDESQKFPSTSGPQSNERGCQRNTPLSILQLIACGSQFEDIPGSRSLNHFFDPSHDSPLTIRNTRPGSVLGLPNLKSPDWALQDLGSEDAGVAQEFAYKNARTYFYDALTAQQKSEREAKWGRTFQTIGQVIHHPQDMGQPQHVRNDLHCDSPECALVNLATLGIVDAYNPSRFEKYALLPQVSQRIQTLAASADGSAIYPGPNNTNVSVFNTPRKFFVGAGKGLAEYTNQNFLSQGTNLTLNNGIVGTHPSYPLPVPGQPTPVSVPQLFPNGVPPFIQFACQIDPANCFLTFYSTIGTDSLNGSAFINDRASTLSIFDQDLQSRKIPQTDPSTGQQYSTERIFALNRFNFDAVHAFLIPRAVSYSAGLINYFFRGKIDYVSDPLVLGKFLIKNLGPEDMSGTFSLYYDAKDGTRKPVLNRQGANVVWETDKPLTAKAGEMSVTPDFDPPADAKTLNEYMLVFKGTMGEEKPENGSVGAVVGKAVQNPYNGALYLAGSTAAGQLQFFKLDKRGFAALQANEPNPLEGLLFGPLSPERPYHYKQAVITTTPSGTTVHKTVALAYRRGLGSTAPDATLALDPAFGALRLLFGINWLAQSPDPKVGTFQFQLRGVNVPGQQPFLSYTRRFLDAQGNPSQTTGAFLLPVAPAGSSFYSDFSKGIMFVSGDGTTFYPRGTTSIHPIGLRIALSAAPSAQLFDTPKPGSTTVSQPTFDVSTVVGGECVVDFLVPNLSGGAGQPNLLPRTLSVPRVRHEVLVSDIETTSHATVIEDFIMDQLVSYEISQNAHGRNYTLTEGCSAITEDWTNFPVPGVKANVQVQRHSEIISRSVAEVALADGKFSFVQDFLDARPGFATVNCGAPVAPGENVFLGNVLDATYSYQGFGPCPAQPATVYSFNDIGTPRQSIYRALTSRVQDAIYLDNNQFFKFRDHPLNGIVGATLFVADTSPLGEIFLASPDLSLIVHEPKSGNMPVLRRDLIPANIVKLVAAVWM